MKIGAVCVMLWLALVGALSACGRESANGAPVPGPYDAAVAGAVPKVEHAVGLQFKRPPRVEARSRTEVRHFLEKQFSDSREAHDLAGTEVAYKLFGLLPDSLNLRRELEDLLTEQIVGFYDPETKVLYVVDSAPPAQVSMVLTHELVHALQDQYLNLDSIQKVQGENDRTSAAQAVIEGQAVYDQLVAATGNRNFIGMIPGGWDRVRQEIRDNQASMPAFANAPMILQETLIFPYLSGAEFMRHFDEHHAGKQPYPPLMPTSTKQILHPETAFFAHRDVPARIILPPPASGTVEYQNTLGEFETRLFLFQHLNDQAASVRGAAGWEGDRYEVIQSPTGARTLVWATLWDSPVGAAQFRGQVLETIPRRTNASSRTISVTPLTIQGRAAVLYIDAPRGAPKPPIDPAKIMLAASS